MSNISSEKPWLKQNFWAGIAVFFILGILIFGGSPWNWPDKPDSQMKMEQSSSPTE